MRKCIAAVCALSLTAALFAGCSSSPQGGAASAQPDDAGSTQSDNAGKTIAFADVGWDSIKFHNAVAGIIAQTAFGYKGWEEITASTPVTHEGILSGEIDVHMENWVDNLEFYPTDLAAGKFIELGVNFDDNTQGIYVPRYVVEGPDAVAPDLKTVEDLAKYPDVFPDDEVPGKGRLYGAIPGWQVDEIMHKKYLHYGLDETFEYFRPGSDAALGAVIAAAYEKGEPIAAYYWEPTWLMGKYDFVLLEDVPYTNQEDFLAGKTACPSVAVTISVSNAFAEANPDFCDFLRKYKTTSAMISEALAYMQDTGADTAAAAKWFLGERSDLLEQWLTPEQAALVQDGIA